MNNHPFLSFVKTTLIGGLFVVIPIVVLTIVVEKAIVLFRAIVAPISNQINIDILGGNMISRLIAFFVILFICFLVGLVANTTFAQRPIDWLEDNVLSIIPGYTFLKRTGETVIGLQSDDLQKVVLVDMEEAWQIGFLMEEIDDDLCAVYIPGAPNPLAGDVVFVKRERLRMIDIPPLDAMKISSKLGEGAKQKLRGQVSKSSFENGIGS